MGNRMEVTITKDDLTDKLKSKYFIVILSNEENLKKCINNNVAGFPETDNGIWAYLDIRRGDYISFYYNGRIFNLYKVEKKYIPYEFKNKKGMGSEEYDPVALPNNQKWKAISTKKGKIYFPYRLSLSLIKETNFETSLIFKDGFERFGINLVPRAGLKKSHFQLSIIDIKKVFSIENISITRSAFTLSDFVEIAKRMFSNISSFSIRDLTNKEIFLQSLIKRVLEASINKYAGIFNVETYDNFEFFSEQTVYGGEADIVIANGSKNIAFIEVKNGSILNKKGELTK